MPRRLSFALAAAVAVALLAWLWWQNNAADGLPSPVVGEAPAAAAIVAAPAPAVAVPPSAAASERIAAAAGDQAQAPLPPDAEWLAVLVVDGDQPVPDAEVHWTIDSDWYRANALPDDEKLALYRDQERLAQRFGRHTRSDAQGFARIAVVTSGASVYARIGERYGTARIGGNRPVPAAGWRVLLETDLTLRVQVLDASGAPAIGVPVATRAFQADGKVLPNGLMEVATAAPDAIAEFRHLQVRLRDFGANDARWFAAAAIPGLDEPGQPFDREAPPKEPLVLRLPPTGRLAARLLQATRPLTKDVMFAVYRDAEDVVAARNRAVRVAPGAGGWAFFPRVTLGGTLRVQARIDSTVVETTVQAPVLPDQEVRVDLTTDGMVALKGRLVGPDGKPFANVTVRTSYAALSTGSGQLQTDAMGRFFWLLGQHNAMAAELRVLVVTYTAPDGTPLRADVAARPLTAGENDLGDIQLTAGVLVVKGRFELERGTSPDYFGSLQFGLEALADRRGPGGEELWELVHGLAQVLLPDGTFELRGVVRPTRHRLFVRAGRHLPVTPREFRVGTNDLVVPIGMGHTVAANCVVPPGVDTKLLRGVLRQQTTNSGADRVEARATAGGKADAPVELQWAALPAGTYSLDVSAAGQLRPFVTIDDIAVPQPAGGDPRLRAIDLSAVARALRVRLAVAGVESVVASGSSSQTSLVFVLPQADDNDWLAVDVRGDEAVLPVPPGRVELLVLRPGCQPCEVAGAEGEVLVTLQPWPTVDLTFPELPPLPSGMQLLVSVHSTVTKARPSGRRFRSEARSGPLDAWYAPGGEFVPVVETTARVPIGDGPHQLRVWLMVRGQRGWQQVQNVQPAELLGGVGIAPIAVRLAAADLQAAAAALTGAGK